jgi:hypothetical protein
MPTQKFIRLDNATGRPEEAYATDSSEGRRDAGKIVALNNRGKLDPSLFPFKPNRLCCWVSRWMCEREKMGEDAQPPPELRELIRSLMH